MTDDDGVLTLIEVRDGKPVRWAPAPEPMPPVDAALVGAPPTGRGVVAVRADAHLPVARPGADLVVRPSGVITAVADEADPTPVSTVPRQRMAASGWQEVFDQVRDLESGNGPDLGVRPGGAITKHEGSTSEPVSVVPSVRMAAQPGAVTSDDVWEVSRLDPDNVENWRPVRSSNGEFSGWLFDMQPPFPGERFTFLAFRNPSRGNLWDIASIAPNVDSRFGHADHVIRTRVGGREMPILCGPAGQPSRTLTEVRGVAAKWMYYTSARMAGHNPGFSL
ncbi:hypothetical protein [Microbacterium sp. 1P10AE]|uniref:hypothetical protein n=1 Tax=Microbacterium sp. 1P10AE TaxID=3132286 RepID=UPI0039A168C7